MKELFVSASVYVERSCEREMQEEKLPQFNYEFLSQNYEAYFQIHISIVLLFFLLCCSALGKVIYKLMLKVYQPFRVPIICFIDSFGRFDLFTLVLFANAAVF